MCLSPILIKNPNYLGEHHSSQTKLERLYRMALETDPKNKQRLVDTSNPYIYVPCGVCQQCQAMKQTYIIQRAQVQALTHYMFMGTLTYDTAHLPYVEVNGYRHNYADNSHFVNMWKRLQKKDAFEGRDAKYILCSEYGGEKHRPHFHFILFLEKKETDTIFTPKTIETRLFEEFKQEWRVCTRKGKYPLYEPLFKYRRKGRFSNFDFHYVNPKVKGNVRDTKQGADVAFYVTKYVLKFDSWFRRKQQALRLNMAPEDYKELFNKIKPKVFLSKHLGETEVAEAYVNQCIEKTLKNSNKEYPCFITTEGKMQPLAPYLRAKYMKEDQAWKFYYRNSTKANDLDSAMDQWKYETEFNKNEDKHKDMVAKFKNRFAYLDRKNQVSGEEYKFNKEVDMHDFVDDVKNDVAEKYKQIFEEWHWAENTSEEFENYSFENDTFTI